MFKEFKEFALKGNVVDMAVGIIIGSAFSKIVSSLVSDIIMPLFGIITGGLNFSNLYIALDGKTYESLEVAEKTTAVFKYGNFITVVIDFIIISFSIFLVIKSLSKFKKKKEEVVEVATKVCPYCIKEVPIEATKCAYCTSDLKK